MADELETDDLAYLAPDFDPATLTVPKLRSILVTHDVSYPSSAKKSQLLDLFNEHVVPQAKKLLSARARVRRTTKGIEDMESSQEVDMRSDDREDPQDLATRTPRRRRKDADDEVEPPRTKSPRKRAPPKSATRKTSSEEAPPPDTEKKRKSPTKKSLASVGEAPPVVFKVEEDVPKPLHLSRAAEDSPFSSDNPFQSGSSPLPAPHSPTDDSRRRTVDPSDTRERSKKKASSPRRKTDLDGANDTTAISNGALARLKKEPSPESEVVPAGEEFTPEEQLELAEAQAGNTAVEIRPAKRRKHAKRAGSGIGNAAAWAISLAMLGGLGTVWRQEKIEVGFCGVGRRPSSHLGGVEIPEWASAIQPQCEPCPAHAFCYPDFQAACESDFVLAPHPLSLGGLVPLPPTCEPDGEKARKVKAVADRAVEELRERNAKYECGEPEVDDEGNEQRVTTPEIQETELKQQVASKRRKGMTQEEFEELWHSAVGEIMTRDEVISSPDGNKQLVGNDTQSGVFLLRSQSLANISILCAAQRSVRVALVKHIWKLVSVVVLTIALGYARWSIISKRRTETKAKQLASSALDRLKTQAAVSAQQPGRVANPWISMGQLRDDILRDEFSTWRRQKLWTRVQTKVEHNSNVRSAVKEDSRSGEVGRVWEWIGALPILEDSRRDSSRYSLGSPAHGGSSSSPSDHSTLIQQQRSTKTAGVEMQEPGNWNENRPIF